MREGKDTLMSKSANVWKVLLLSMVLGVGLCLPPARAAAAETTSAADLAAAREHLAKLSRQDYLSDLSATVAEVVRPAVVEVRVVKWVRQPEMPDMNDLFKRFFQDANPPFEFHFRQWGTPDEQQRQLPQNRIREYQLRGIGSGVVVDAEKGYVLTNWHVVGGADEVKVLLADDREFKAEWIRQDPATDLAVIKIKADGLVDVPLGNSDAVRVGEQVLAIGAPQELRETVTAGIVSAKGRVTNGGPMYQNFIQTDAAINRGNSGGPLVNMRGEVIGINNSISISPTEMGLRNDGIGFAIPSNMAKEVMTQLIEKGKVTRGYLGVWMQEITDPKLAASLRLPADTKGVLVTEVNPDTPASKAGLAAGDVIVSVDGRAVEDMQELRKIVAKLEPDTTVKLEYYRDGAKRATDVTIAPQPAELTMSGYPGPTTAPSPAASERFGLKVAEITESAAKDLGYETVPEGVLITDVADRSDAQSQGLRPGMVILDVQGAKVTGVEEFDKAMASKDAAKGVRLRVLEPGGAKRFVFVRPADEAK